MANETILTIIGNLTADPETRQTQNGRTVANFTIASTPRTYNRQSGQFEDGAALFMRCSAWGDLADHCARSLNKGMRVMAQGRLSQRTYQTKDGSDRTVMEMTVDEIGPSLRYATAQVTRSQSRNTGGGVNGNGFAGASRNQSPMQARTPQRDAAASDPWGGGVSDFGGGFDDDF